MEWEKIIKPLNIYDYSNLKDFYDEILESEVAM